MKLAILLLLLAVAAVSQELPYDSVDCDNANGNPKLCTVEPDEAAPPVAPKPLPQAFPKSTMTMNVFPVTITGGSGAATGSETGYKFQIGPTVSFGGVKVGSQTRWGGRAGIFINYSLGWAVGMQFEAQWNNLPGYGHGPSFSFGPNCHW